MAKCSKCGAEIAGTGGCNITWKIYCRKCFPRIKDIVEQVYKDLEEEKLGQKAILPSEFLEQQV